MCGIAGIISPHPLFIQQQRLQIMADTLQHRGPDGEGFFMSDDGLVGLAHRRLSIIDLSAAASQPMQYLHYTIIFNGEIYNYKEIKSQLQQKGYSFKTQSDTEIIPAAYDCYGAECLNYFDGMFAFALYDSINKKVVLARDRFGEKPLYYHAEFISRGRFQQFLFASEMKALWAAGIPRQLNGTMMLNYLALGYTQNPIKKTDTFYSNILSLPAGHYITVSPSEGRVQMHKWYELKTADEKISAKKNAYEIAETFRNLFFTSVERRLRSDVAVGTSLSGGLDSSSVVAAIHAGKMKSAQWKNVGFTAIFPGYEKDESAYSKTVAEHFQIRQFTTAPQAEDCAKYFQQLMHHQEEPLQSSSVFTQFMVYKLAKENGITVLLDGQGADEILAGYNRYLPWYLQQLVRKNLSSFLRERKLLGQNEFAVNPLWQSIAAAYMPHKTSARLQQKAVHSVMEHPFIEKDFLMNYVNRDTLQKPVVRNLEDILYYTTFYTGLPELLRYADRNSMAHSREVRLPFLFHELAEFIFSLPAAYKIKDGFTKWILRKSMENFLPAKIAWRKGKIGFEPPQKLWMRNKNVQEMITESKGKLVKLKVLKPQVMEKKIVPAEAHDANNYDWRYLSAAFII